MAGKKMTAMAPAPIPSTGVRVASPMHSHLEDETIARIQSVYADDLFHGKIQFVYRSGNNMTTWNRIFGVRFDGDIE